MGCEPRDLGGRRRGQCAVRGREGSLQEERFGLWRVGVLQSGSLDLSYVQALGRLPGSLVGSPVSANCPLRPYLRAGRWRVSQVLGGAGQSGCPPGVWAPVFAWSRDSLPSVICHPPPCHVRSHEPKPLPFPDTPPPPLLDVHPVPGQRGRLGALSHSGLGSDQGSAAEAAGHRLWR